MIHKTVGNDPALGMWQTIFLFIATFPLCRAEYICATPKNQSLLYATEPYVSTSLTQVPAKFRITPIYTESFRKFARAEEVKRELVEYALNYWTEAMKPKRPLTGPLRLSRGCIDNKFVLRRGPDGQHYVYCTKDCVSRTLCFQASVPDEYLDKCRIVQNDELIEKPGTDGPGIPDTDYALMVDISNEQFCGTQVLAFATVCQVESNMDRPILGYINFCPQSLNLQYPRLLIGRTAALHELAHALGFNALMYAFMRDENGQPRTPRNSETGEPNLGRFSNGQFIPSKNTLDHAIREWVSTAGTFKKNRTILKTPNLLKYAREHFGCSDLDGVELENQGGDGTAVAHFEKRVVLNELMAGSIAFEAVISELTLAFFMDTGWYNVDMTKAQKYTWASKAGCKFLRQSCYEYIRDKTQANQSVLPWCNRIVPNITNCLSYANAYGSCNIKRFSSTLYPENRYFTSLPGIDQDELAFYGGSDVLTDYCPYVMPRLIVQDSPSSYCGHTENDEYVDKRTNLQLQTYGSNARCFNHDSNIPWKSHQCKQVYTLTASGASCHQYNCSDNQGIVVLLGSKQYPCPLDGGLISIDTVGRTAYVQGKLSCPPCKSVCNKCPTKTTTHLTPPDRLPTNVPCPSKQHAKQAPFGLISLLIFVHTELFLSHAEFIV